MSIYGNNCPYKVIIVCVCALEATRREQDDRREEKKRVIAARDASLRSIAKETREDALPRDAKAAQEKQAVEAAEAALSRGRLEADPLHDQPMRQVDQILPPSLYGYYVHIW